MTSAGGRPARSSAQQRRDVGVALGRPPPARRPPSRTPCASRVSAYVAAALSPRRSRSSTSRRPPGRRGAGTRGRSPRRARGAQRPPRGSRPALSPRDRERRVRVRSRRPAQRRVGSPPAARGAGARAPAGSRPSTTTAPAALHSARHRASWASIVPRIQPPPWIHTIAGQRPRRALRGTKTRTRTPSASLVARRSSTGSAWPDVGHGSRRRTARAPPRSRRARAARAASRISWTCGWTGIARRLYPRYAVGDNEGEPTAERIRSAIALPVNPTSRCSSAGLPCVT